MNRIFILCFTLFFITSAFAFTIPDDRIIGGSKAKIEEFPYQVGIEVDPSPEDVGGRCGGVLLSKWTVLTAAHCVDYDRTGVVSLGSNQYLKGDVISFSESIIHPNYDDKFHFHDIAVLYLESAANIDNKTIAVMPLRNAIIGNNVKVELSGFGEIGHNIETNQLHHVSLTTAEAKVCEPYYLYPILPSHICAVGAKKKSACYGDSGGPLVHGWPQHPQLVGIVSYGRKKCTKGYPVVFTRVQHYYHWIKKLIRY